MLKGKKIMILAHPTQQIYYCSHSLFPVFIFPCYEQSFLYHVIPYRSTKLFGEFTSLVGESIQKTSTWRLKATMVFHGNGIRIFERTFSIHLNIHLLDPYFLHSYRKCSSNIFEIVAVNFLTYQLFGKFNEPIVLNVFKVLNIPKNKKRKQNLRYI